MPTKTITLPKTKKSLTWPVMPKIKKTGKKAYV